MGAKIRDREIPSIASADRPLQTRPSPFVHAPCIALLQGPARPRSQSPAGRAGLRRPHRERGRTRPAALAQHHAGEPSEHTRRERCAAHLSRRLATMQSHRALRHQQLAPFVLLGTQARDRRQHAELEAARRHPKTRLFRAGLLSPSRCSLLSRLQTAAVHQAAGGGRGGEPAANSLVPAAPLPLPSASAQGAGILLLGCRDAGGAPSWDPRSAKNAHGRPRPTWCGSFRSATGHGTSRRAVADDSSDGTWTCQDCKSCSLSSHAHTVVARDFCVREPVRAAVVPRFLKLDLGLCKGKGGSLSSWAVCLCGAWL